MKFDYLIIGSGIAGISAAETLRKYDKNTSIGLISNEPHNPYSKVLLPFYLKGKINFDQLFIRGKNFWQKNNISFICGEVEELDRTNKKIKYVDLSRNFITHKVTIVTSRVTSMGEVSYKKLLIASGARAKKLDFPGSDLPGIFYFRDLNGTINIKKNFDNFYSDTPVYQHTPVYRSEELKPVIYGASFIALEFAGIFAHFGIGAKIIFRGPYFWSRLLDPQGGKLVEDFLEQAGMEIHNGEEIKSISPVIARADDFIGPRQSVFKIETGRDSYQATFLGLGVGLEPNLEFARLAGLKVNQGIITDEFLQTSDPDIFAAGDIAEFYDIIIGRYHVLGNWLNSDMQGRVAAMNMLGIKKSFELVSFYNFNFDGLRSKLDRVRSAEWARSAPDASSPVGSVSGSEDDDGSTSRNRGSFNICALGDTNSVEPLEVQTIKRDQQYLRTFSKDNRIVGAIIINAPKLREKIITAIKICANFKTSSSVFN